MRGESNGRVVTGATKRLAGQQPTGEELCLGGTRRCSGRGWCQLTRMTNPIPRRAMRFVSRFLLLILALVICSCRTAPETAIVPKSPANIPPTVEGYKKVVEDQLGPLWYRLVKANEDYLSVGTVDTRCEIPAAGGRVRNLKIISNTGGWMDERIVRSAIEKLRALPIPPKVFQRLHQDHLVLEESFTIFAKEPPPAPSPTTQKKTLGERQPRNCATRRRCQLSGCRTESCALLFSLSFA
jgi:hypothetical protein